MLKERNTQHRPSMCRQNILFAPSKCRLLLSISVELSILKQTMKPCQKFESRDMLGLNWAENSLIQNVCFGHVEESSDEVLTAIPKERLLKNLKFQNCLWTPITHVLVCLESNPSIWSWRNCRVAMKEYKFNSTFRQSYAILLVWFHRLWTFYLQYLTVYKPSCVFWSFPLFL